MKIINNLLKNDISNKFLDIMYIDNNLIFIIFSQIEQATNEIISYLKRATEFNAQKDQNIIVNILLEDKKQFIYNIIFIKTHKKIIEYKTGLSYIEYLVKNSGILTQILYDQLQLIDIWLEQENQCLTFN